jgi:transketolase
MALTSSETPSIIALSRQGLPHLESSSIEKASRGGYVALEESDATITLVSTGSEVSLCLEAAALLKEKSNVKARVVVGHIDLGLRELS